MTDSEQGPERELDDLQEQTDDLGHRIGEAREDWERKKADAAVPGAEPDPDSMEAEDPQATAYPAKGSSDDVGEDLDDVRDPANEDL